MQYRAVCVWRKCSKPRTPRALHPPVNPAAAGFSAGLKARGRVLLADYLPWGRNPGHVFEPGIWRLHDPDQEDYRRPVHRGARRRCRPGPCRLRRGRRCHLVARQGARGRRHRSGRGRAQLLQGRRRLLRHQLLDQLHRQPRVHRGRHRGRAEGLREGRRRHRGRLPRVPRQEEGPRGRHRLRGRQAQDRGDRRRGRRAAQVRGTDLRVVLRRRPRRHL